MTKTIYAFILNFMSISVFAQTQLVYQGEPLNKYENNKREGVWKAIDPAKKLTMSCEYKEDSLISDINYYSDSLKVITIIRSNLNEFHIYKGNDTIVASFRKLKNKILFVDRSGREFDQKFQDWIFERLSIVPTYIGGNEELMKFISNTINTTNLNGKTGRVKVQFVIDKYGNVQMPKIIEKSAKALNEEALRVIKLMPRWIAGSQNGKFVPCYFTIPMLFN